MPGDFVRWATTEEIRTSGWDAVTAGGRRVAWVADGRWTVIPDGVRDMPCRNGSGPRMCRLPSIATIRKAVHYRDGRIMQQRWAYCADHIAAGNGRVEDGRVIELAYVNAAEVH
jgi:hypothetical protein